MLTKFRNLYPQGSILSELIDIDRGVYIVRVSIQINGVTLATGLAGADVVEKAEDNARNRALQTLVLEDGHLSLNLATKAAPEKITASTIMPQEKIVAATVKSPAKSPVKSPVKSTVINPPEPISLVSEPPVQTKAVSAPEPEPIPEKISEPILDSFEPELPVTILDDREEMLEPPLELQPPEENYAIAEPTATETPAEEFDFNQIRHKIDLEMKRLSWTKEQGRDYLLSTYGKRSRLHLTDDELLEFWHYLETLSN